MASTQVEAEEAVKETIGQAEKPTEEHSPVVEEKAATTAEEAEVVVHDDDDDDDDDDDNEEGEKTEEDVKEEVEEDNYGEEFKVAESPIAGEDHSNATFDDEEDEEDLI
ncbi:hypothetical protein Tsubulata_012165 [Turnera subulata]|uniref:Uncharacterized protein n=1 Tax=Turnera subulata TaxID=218843 RepID=A0A9Q0GCZ3_9ROSI|nr:hypothetical protein Tsubulata_012165 [Turnera subulata]